jgi:hypothetical protein
MDSKQANTRNSANWRETLENKQTQLLEREASRQRAMVSAWVAATLVALVATVTLLESCGSDHGSIRPASSEHAATATPQQNVVASTEGLQGTVGGSLQQSQLGSSDESRSVPPDAVVAVSDTFVTAGQPIEVVAQGTPDVAEMALSDGHGDALPMVRDSTGDTWRVNYRVPLRPKTDRLGLAVTAKNDSHQWRRVWVFLQIDDGKQKVETGSTGPLDPEQK